MSGGSVVDRIAAVMRDHVRVSHSYGRRWCECGAEWDINDGHAAHVASVVADALGLQEERGAQDEDGYVWFSGDIVDILDRPVTRLVGPWVPAQGGTE